MITIIPTFINSTISISFFRTSYLLCDIYQSVLQLTEAKLHIMHKLFSLSFRRIVNRLNQPELNASNVGQALQSNKIPPCGEGLLYRLPREELKHIANIPCPINNLQESISKTIIASSKAIRHHMKINEEKICSKCPFKENCDSAKLPFTGTIDNGTKDLLIFWSGLSNLYKPEDIYFRQWVSAYKLGDSIIAAINDLSEQGKEIQQYQKLRVAMIQQYKDTMSKKAVKKEDKQEQFSLDQQFKVIEKLTHNQSPQLQGEAQLHANKSSKKDFSFDDIEQFQPKTKVTKDTHKQRKLQQSQKSLKNSIGYQTIQKRQNMDNDPKPYQKPKQKKIEKQQFQQVIKQLDFQTKNPKIKESKQRPLNKFGQQQYSQRQAKFQNKKNGWNAGKEKYDNKRIYNQNSGRFNEENQRNQYQERGSNKDRNVNKSSGVRQNQRDFIEREYQQERPTKNYKKYEEKTNQKYSSKSQFTQSRSYERQENKFKQPSYQREQPSFQRQQSPKQVKPKTRNQETSNDFSHVKQVRQKQNYPATPKVRQTETKKQKVETQGRVGRNITRRSRSTSTNSLTT